MRHFKLFTIALVLVPLLSLGQTFKIQNSNSSIVVSGTSSLHDWDIDAEDFSGTIELNDFENVTISKLSVNVLAESLKSGKGGMDKNTYKALNTKEFKTIAFKLSDFISSTKTDASTFVVKCNGALTISGVTKTLPFEFLFTKLDQGVNLTGSKSIKMTDFGVEPPTALLGTIKTGDEVTIKFNTTFN